MNPKQSCLVIGFLGGLLPNALTILAKLSSNEALPNWTYFLALAFYGLLGMFVVWVHSEDKKLKALTFGVSAPGFIQGLIAQGTKQQIAMLFSFVTAFAQETPQVQKIELFFKGEKTALTVEVVRPDGVVMRYPVEGQKMTVTEPALEIRVVGKGVEDYTIKPVDVTQYQIVTSEKLWSGFFEGLGVQSSARFGVKVTPLK